MFFFYSDRQESPGVLNLSASSSGFGRLRVTFLGTTFLFLSYPGYFLPIEQSATVLANSLVWAKMPTGGQDADEGPTPSPKTWQHREKLLIELALALPSPPPPSGLSAVAIALAFAMPIGEGDEFVGFKAFKDAMADWSIAGEYKSLISCTKSLTK